MLKFGSVFGSLFIHLGPALSMILALVLAMPFGLLSTQTRVTAIVRRESSIIEIIIRSIRKKIIDHLSEGQRKKYTVITVFQ